MTSTRIVFSPWKSLRLVVALLLSGCSAGPDFVRPAAPAVDRYTDNVLPPQTTFADVDGGNSQRFVQGLDIPGQWWTLFHSPELNDLIEEALKSNPNVQAAQAALRVAQENVYAQEGTYFPSVGVNVNPTRQRTSGSLSSVPASGAYIYSLHTAQLSISFVPDVFGGNRREVESLQAQAEAQRFALYASQVTLTTNLVSAAVQIASLRDQLAAFERLVQLQTDQLGIMRTQFKLGEIAELAVIAQQAALAQAQAQIPPLRRQLVQQVDLLAALTGRPPSEHQNAVFKLSSLQLPEELPVSLPSKLVEQRPDVRAAEANWHSACAEIGVAAANMLPQFTLDASSGSAAIRIADLFTAGTGFWSVAGNISQPVFQGGTLLHRKRAAEAAYDEAAAQYRSTLVTALQNVADTLQALQLDAEALRASADAERKTQETLAIARRQFDLGDVSYLALLISEQAYQQALVNRIQAQANRYADSAALYQALGGGWWNRNDVTPDVVAVARQKPDEPPVLGSNQQQP